MASCEDPMIAAKSCSTSTRPSLNSSVDSASCTTTLLSRYAVQHAYLIVPILRIDPYRLAERTPSTVVSRNFDVLAGHSRTHGRGGASAADAPDLDRARDARLVVRDASDVTARKTAPSTESSNAHVHPNAYR